MGEGPQKQQISAGLLAHVDAGKIVAVGKEEA